MDLFSLTVYAGLFFGIVIGDATFFGHRARVQISVPPSLVQSGFNEVTAERVFRAKVERIEQVSVVFPSQDVDLKSGTNLFAVVAKPLNLDGIVLSLQQTAGLDVASIDGSILTNPKTAGLDMVMVVSSPSRPAERFKLTQGEGDVTDLIERSAIMALEEVAPVRATLSEFRDGLSGDGTGFDKARATAMRALARPWDPAFAVQRVLLRNLLGLLALIKNDIAGAEEQYQLAASIPGQPSWTQALIAANQAFLAVAAKQPRQAETYLQIVMQSAHFRYAPLPTVVSERLLTLHGLVVWSAGNVAEAESLLRAAIAELPTDPEAHIYLAQLLTASGDIAGAKAELTTAANVGRFERPLLGLVQSDFVVNPIDGGIKRREFTNNPH